MKKELRQKGFTLVELAIVMVIIGLLVGAVLKGQSMIENAKIKNLADQYRSLVASAYGYQDKYGVLPGDDNLAAGRSWATGTCTTTSGNADGQIYEYFAAAEHLACSGFIKGSYNGTTENIKHTYGGNVYIYYQTIQGRTGNLIRFDGLPADIAESLDRTLDDGIYTQGSCRAGAAYTAGTIIAQLGCYY